MMRQGMNPQIQLSLMVFVMAAYQILYPVGALGPARRPMLLTLPPC